MTGDLKVSLEDFSIVNGNRAKLLRFSLVWCFDTTDARYGIKTEGCLAGRRSDGSLAVSLPVHRMTGGAKKRVQIMTPDLHDACAKLIDESGYADLIGRTAVSRSLDFDPAPVKIDGLPKELTNE